MPWHIEERDGRFCVIKDDDGDNEGCHDTRAEAEAQMRALYANEPEGRAVDDNPPGQEKTKDDQRSDDLVDKLDLVPNMRSARFDELEISEWSEGFKFEGHAAVFDEVADIGEFTEEIERGAFRKALASADNIPMLYHHNDRLPILASTGGGTLKLSEDVKGLKVEADVADTQLGRDVRTLAKRGDIRGMSYGFISGRGNSSVSMRDGKLHRKIVNFRKLLDVSPTWDPAYRSAEAEFRSLTMQYADSPEVLQRLLMGAYPQLEEKGIDLDRRDEEAEDGAESGVSAETRSRLAARKRRLAVMSITLQGGNDAQG